MQRLSLKGPIDLCTRTRNMTLAEELAQRIVSLRFDELPVEAVAAAKAGLLDTLGVALVGQNEDATRTAASLLLAEAKHGPSLIFGTTRRASPLAAAFINGMAANVLDFDDCNASLGGHPSAPILGAVVALAEQVGASGRQVLAAYIAGVETAAKIGRGVNDYHYEHGWHPTSTLGVFGVAAACTHLLGLTREETAIALAIAASHASGIKANFGTATKSLHIGNCARNGMMAALLARQGFTAAVDAFEHKQGFLRVYNGAGNFSTARVLEQWAQPLDIVMPGIQVKQHPCCLSVQSAVDAMIALARDHDLNASEVARVDAATHRRRLEHTDRPAPDSGIDAMLSLQYCLARALIDKQIALEDFKGDAHREPSVCDLMKRIQVRAHPDSDKSEDNDFFAEIAVTMRDGAEHRIRIDRPVGHEPGQPLPLPLLKAKFRACASRVLPLENIGSVIDLVFQCDRLDSIHAITNQLSAPSALALAG